MSEQPFSVLPWQDVLWPLSQGDALGNLDWVSGVVFLNEDRETYERIAQDRARSPHDEEIVRTLTHEVFHFYQLVLTGFLHRWVWALDQFVSRAAAQARQRPLGSFADIVAFSAALPQSVPEGALADLRRHEAQLSARDGATGLSVRSLVESHATFVEWGRSYTNNSDGYLTLLNSHGVTGDYRAAYDFVRDQLGGTLAHELFSLLSFLALCCSDPVPSFTRMVAWIRRLDDRQPHGDLDIDVERLIHDCCGYINHGSPAETADTLTSVPAYQQAVAAFRKAVRTGSIKLIDVFQRPLAYLDDLRDIAAPAVVLQPVISGGIPAYGVPDEQRLATLFHLMLGAWYRTLFWQYTAEAPATTETDDGGPFPAHEREKQLAAARAGNTDALFNLGVMSVHGGNEHAARVWWRLAAIEGDTGSMRALGQASASLGNRDAADFWLERSWQQGAHVHPVPLSGAALVEMGQAVDSADPYAADECFRRSLHQGSVCGGYLYGSRVVDRDPVEGLAYLACAAGADDLSDPEDYACARDADALIKSLRQKWGGRKFRKYLQQATARLEGTLFY